MLLGSPKADLDKLFGKPVMARNILGLPGEKAGTYSWGDFEIIVGFLNDLARYVAVKRRRGPNSPLTPAELAGALSLHAPASTWTIEIPDAPAKKTPEPRRRTKIETPPTTYLSYVEKDPKAKDKVVREIRGWMPGNKPFAFFYLPALEGKPPVLASEWGVNQALA